MPRERGPSAAPLSAAWHFTLMTGRLSGDKPATARLPGGWAQAVVDAVQVGGAWDYTPAGDRLWAMHGEALTAEARVAGFEPFWMRQRKPSGPAYRRWLEGFLARSRS